MPVSVLQADLAAGTALSNSTTETVLSSYTVKAYGLQAGHVLRLHAAVRATATNSTDTLQVKLRMGPTTLTGTTIVDATAVDVANADVVIIDMIGVVRSISSTATTIVWSGTATIEAAEGTGTARSRFESITNLDNTAAQKIEVTGTWSVASASNSCQSENFVLMAFY